MAASHARLVEDHLHMVHAIAAKLRGRLGRTMEPGDLVGYGTKGLIEAAQRFDPKLGPSFPAFAYHRIRGAIFDGMRTMGWYSRGDYARFRAEERQGEYLAAAAEREATQRAVAPPEAAPDKPAVLEAIAELLAFPGSGPGAAGPGRRRARARGAGHPAQQGATPARALLLR
jgi:RNA polymerase sigma factor (sigma-70 family)